MLTNKDCLSPYGRVNNKFMIDVSVNSKFYNNTSRLDYTSLNLYEILVNWFSKPHARLICLGRYLYFGLVVVWISVSDEALLGHVLAGWVR